MTNAPPADDIPRPPRLGLHPFRGLRYDTGAVDPAAVLAPPYDVIDDTHRAQLVAQDPHNVVRLTLPRIDDDPADAGAPSPYAAAAARLGRWRAEGVLRVDGQPALYVYEQDEAGHRQRGLLGALDLSPAEDGIVLPHENTMAGPVADRLALTAATETNLEPIFLVYDGGGTATEVVAGCDANPPVLDVRAGATRHQLWPITDEDQLAAVAADLAERRALIADGHHRYATYLRYQQDRHAAGDGPGPWDRGLAFLVDSGRFGPRVEPIHRVLPATTLAVARDAAAAGFRVSPVLLPDAADALAAAAGGGPAYVLSDGETAVLLDHPDAGLLADALPADRSAAWRDLHVSVASALLFGRLLGIEEREGTVDVAHDVDEALAMARATGATAVLLAPTPVAAVAAVAAAGDRMPRKSTLFVPKPATGVVLRALADQG